ncbi:MAG: contractile injection system tape measure protein [Xenococcus sp. MO_188.B8]|nr:contractile injection system tape measure protein [Xenococcus sp. MO_188.B8]
MNQQRHIIKKQIIELNLSSQQGAFELQNEVSRIYRYKVVPLIDNLFSQFSNLDTIHRINTLEINLGNIDINNLEQELIDKIVEQIQQQLAEKISRSSSSFSAQPQAKTDLHKSSSLLPREVLSKETDRKRRENTEENKVPSVNATHYQIPSDKIESSNIASKRASQLEIFSYFIQTGLLPWWAERLSKQELEKSCDRLLETSPEQVKLILAESFKEEKYSRRIIYQFSDSTLLKFTQLFASNLYNFIADYHNDIQQIYKRKINIFANIPPSQFRLEFWRGIFFRLLLEQYTQSKKIQFIRNHLLHIAASFRLNYWLLLDKMLETAENFKQEDGVFKSQLPEILAQINPTVSRENSSIANESEPSINLEKARSQAKDKLTNTVAPFSDSEEIYIYNSGLVLLWPFLPRFFESLKLIQREQFANSESAQRAVLILQYLVDAATEIPEHLLPLNKILCGIDLLEPVAANLEISEPQRDECENLLSAVIGNWSILKNTSIEGFRRAFLQREGILKVRDGSWILQVEQATYDILLDRMPWNISVVKLPWIEGVLYVEW